MTPSQRDQPTSEASTGSDTGVLQSAVSAASGDDAVQCDDAHRPVVNGVKLYLNYSRGVQKARAEDVSGHIVKADANWPKVPKWRNVHVETG